MAIIEEPKTSEVDLHIPENLNIKFSHIQLYVDHIEHVNEYKSYEDSINKFHHEYGDDESVLDITRGKDIWNSIQEDAPAIMENYSSHGRDVVKQLIAGFGFRVTGCNPPVDIASPTKTVLVTSSDPRGIQIVVTSRDDHEEGEAITNYLHFDRGKLKCLVNSLDY